MKNKGIKKVLVILIALFLVLFNNPEIYAMDDDWGDDFDTAGIIYLNEYVDAEINDETDVDFFQFTAPSTGRYTIKEYSRMETICILYDSDLNDLGSSIGTDSDCGIIARDLNAGEVYYLEIRCSPDSYYDRYTLFIEPPVTNQPDDHGNDFSSASAITAGNPVNGLIDYIGDIDFFKYVPQASGLYTIGTTGTTDTSGILYDEYHSILSQNGDSVGNCNFSITYRLIANQVYYIDVRLCGHITGSYDLKITQTTDDYGDNFDTAASITAGNQVNGSINYNTDMDYFKFVPTVSGNYIITTSGTTDTYGLLFDSNKVWIDSNNDSSDTNFYICKNLIADLTYYIEVTSYTAVGSYALKVFKPNDDFGNDFTSASGITVDNQITGNIDYAKDVDYFKFIPQITGKYIFGTTGTTNTYGYLYDGNKNVLSQNDDSIGLNFSISYNLNANQMYYIEVKHSSTGVGNYSFRATLYDDGYNDFTSATIIDVQNPKNASIDYSGDIDCFKFIPTVSGTYMIETSGAADTYGYLYDNSTSHLLLAENHDAEAKNFSIKYNLIANQVYYVKVKGFNDNIGEYNLSIFQPKHYEYKYDNLGRLIQVTLPSGEIINYEYDKNGNLIKSTKQ